MPLLGLQVLALAHARVELEQDGKDVCAWPELGAAHQLRSGHKITFHTRFQTPTAIN